MAIGSWLPPEHDPDLEAKIAAARAGLTPPGSIAIGEDPPPVSGSWLSGGPPPPPPMPPDVPMNIPNGSPDDMYITDAMLRGDPPSPTLMNANGDLPEDFGPPRAPVAGPPAPPPSQFGPPPPPPPPPPAPPAAPPQSDMTAGPRGPGGPGLGPTIGPPAPGTDPTAPVPMSGGIGPAGMAPPAVDDSRPIGPAGPAGPPGSVNWEPPAPAPPTGPGGGPTPIGPPTPEGYDPARIRETTVGGTSRTRVGSTLPQLPQESEIDRLKRQVREGEQAIVDRYGNIINSQTRAADLAALRDKERIAEETSATAAAARAAEADKAAGDAAREKLATYRQKTDEYVNEAANLEVNPNRVYGNMNFGGQLAVIIGSALGGALMGGGYTTKNEFVASMDKFIDNDIRAQEHNIANKKWRVNQRETIYEQMRREGVDAGTARQLYSEGIYKRALKMVDLKAAKYDSDIARENAVKLNEEIGLKINDFQLGRRDRELKEAQAEYQKKLAAMAAAANARIAAEKEQRKMFLELFKHNQDIGYTDDQAQKSAYYHVYGPAKGVDYSELAGLSKTEKGADGVAAQRFALETKVEKLPGVPIPADEAKEVNKTIRKIYQRNIEIRDLIALIGSPLPDARAQAKLKMQKIANIERDLQNTGVPNKQDLAFLLVDPEDLPALDVLGTYRHKLQTALENDEPRFLESVRYAYANGTPVPGVARTRQVPK